MNRVSPALLRLVAATNAARSPVPDHHRLAYATLSRGAKTLTDGERWFLESILRLPTLSERQWERLREIESRIEGAHE